LLTCRHPLLALHHQGQEKTPLVKTSDRLDNLRANGNLASTPYPAISGFISLVLLKNVVLGEINPSASRAALR
jgi:hypothetical protein